MNISLKHVVTVIKPTYIDPIVTINKIPTIKKKKKKKTRVKGRPVYH